MKTGGKIECFSRCGPMAIKMPKTDGNSEFINFYSLGVQLQLFLELKRNPWFAKSAIDRKNRRQVLETSSSDKFNKIKGI